MGQASAFCHNARINLGSDDPLARALQGVSRKRRTQTLVALARIGLAVGLESPPTASKADLVALVSRVERLCELLEAGAFVPVGGPSGPPRAGAASDTDDLAADAADKRRNLLAGFGLTDLLDGVTDADVTEAPAI